MYRHSNTLPRSPHSPPRQHSLRIDGEVLDRLDLVAGPSRVIRLNRENTRVNAGDTCTVVSAVTFSCGKGVDREQFGFLYPGQPVFSINAEGKIESELPGDRCHFDVADVMWWLSNHFEFAFTLDGTTSPFLYPAGPVSATKDGHRESYYLQWIQRLDTTRIRSEQVNVAVEVRRKGTADEQHILTFGPVISEDRAWTMKVEARLPSGAKAAPITVPLGYDENGATIHLMLEPTADCVDEDPTAGAVEELVRRELQLELTPEPRVPPASFFDRARAAVRRPAPATRAQIDEALAQAIRVNTAPVVSQEYAVQGDAKAVDGGLESLPAVVEVSALRVESVSTAFVETEATENGEPPPDDMEAPGQPKKTARTSKKGS